MPNLLDDETKLNPGQKNYEAEFNGSGSSNRQSIQNAENQPTNQNTADKNEKNSLGFYEKDSASPKKQGVRQRISAATRNKIIGIGGAGIIGGGAFFGIGALPGITIVNFKEVIDQKFGSSIESVIDRRSGEIWVKKINSSNKTASIKGLCGKNIQVACRFDGMSDKEIQKLIKRAKNAGVEIEVDADSKKSILGKRTVKTLTVDGKTMSAGDFANEIRRGDGSVRKAMQSVMKPKIAVWSGAKVSNLFSKLGITKAKNVSAATSVEDAKSKIKDNQKGVEVDSGGRVNIKDDDPDKDNKNAQNKIADEIEGNKSKTAEAGERVRTNALNDLDVSGKVAANTAKNIAGSVAKGLLITGYLDSACTVVNTISALGYAAKVIGAVQLIRFATTFMNTADAVKAGEATNESIQALGEILTTSSSLDPGTAFDSYGYQWMAYGLLGNSEDTAEFRVGGGLPGTLTQIGYEAQKIAGSGEVCNFIQNPGVRIGSAILGIAAAIASGGSITVGQVAASAGLGVSLSIIQAFAMPLLADMVAGEFINDTTVGKSSGNAAISGAGALFSQNSNSTGLYPLTKEQAVVFDQGVKAEYIAQAKQDSIDETGLFDATNPNSLVGSLTTQLASTLTSSSLADASGKLVALITNPVSKTASAVDTDPAAQYEVCADDEYKELGLATDPFCNPVYGLSETALAMDPDEIIKTMYEKGYIDDNGSPLGDYSTFISECVDSTNPFGIQGNEDTQDKIKPITCIPGKSDRPEEFWVYTIDSQIYEKMQCLIEDDAAACGSVQAAPMTPSGTCPAGTSGVPEIKSGWEDGEEKSITLCGIPELPRTAVRADVEFVKSIYGGLAANKISTHAVNAVAAPSLLQIIQTAKEKGVTIGATFSYRSYNEQKAIRAIKTLDSSGNLTSSTLPGSYSSERAEAGRSNHQMGLSLDFDETSMRWLKTCIAQNLDGTDDGRCYGWYDDVGPNDPKHFTYKPKS